MTGSVFTGDLTGMPEATTIEAFIAARRRQTEQHTEAFHLPGRHPQKRHAPRRGIAPKDLLPQESKAITTYTGASYRTINNGLRRGDPPLSDSTQRTIDDLDAAIRKTRLKNKMKVYRGITPTPGFPPPPIPMPTGTVIQDKGFTSTSKDPGVSDNFAGGVVFEITLPPGTRALDIDRLELSKFESEREVLLPRGTAWRVTRETNRDGTRIIHLTVVPDESEEE